MSAFVGSRLREERQRLALSQHEFAALGGVRRGAQANYEADARVPDGTYLAALAAGGVDILFVLTGQRTPLSANSVTPDEQSLLASYRRAAHDDQALVRRFLAVLSAAQPASR